MMLSVPTCPNCGKPAIRVRETVPCYVSITPKALVGLSQTHEYDGDESDMQWDDQAPAVDGRGRALVDCGEHEWKTKIDY